MANSTTNTQETRQFPLPSINVCRVIQRPVTIKNPPAHHLMTGRGRSERIYRH